MKPQKLIQANKTVKIFCNALHTKNDIKMAKTSQKTADHRKASQLANLLFYSKQITVGESWEVCWDVSILDSTELLRSNS